MAPGVKFAAAEVLFQLNFLHFARGIPLPVPQNAPSRGHDCGWHHDNRRNAAGQAADPNFVEIRLPHALAYVLCNASYQRHRKALPQVGTYLDCRLWNICPTLPRSTDSPKLQRFALCKKRRLADVNLQIVPLLD